MNDFLDLLGGIFLTPITLGAVKLPFHLLQFILEFLLPLLLAFGVYKLALYGLKRLLSSLKAKEQASTLVHKWVRIVFRICWLILFIILIGRLFGAAIGEYFQKFYAFLNQPILSSESTTISFVTIILMIPLFYLASWAGKMSRGLVNHAFLDRLGLDESRRYTLTKLVRYTVVVLVLLIGLSVIGIDLSILTVFFGVLGIGLGFGLQHTVANFFAGIVIIFSRPIKVGDKILVDDIEGTVMEVKALSTVINTLTEETILLPNSHLVHNMVHNYSYRSRRIIISNTVQVHYRTDLDKALAVLADVGMENPYSDGLSNLKTRVLAFEDSGISLELRTWIGDVGMKHNALSWTYLEIWRKFRSEGIEIPYPQVDLHIKDKGAP